jgi:hypothetical protein
VTEGGGDDDEWDDPGPSRARLTFIFLLVAVVALCAGLALGWLLDVLNQW